MEYITFPVSDKVQAPWRKIYGDVPAHIDYPDISMVEGLRLQSLTRPDQEAFEFMGGHTTFKKMMQQIDQVARSLRALGIKEGDCVTVCMPNAPQTVLMFYAINKVGAIASMIHPLSSENEIEFYLNDSNSVLAITLDQFYSKFEAIREKVKLKNLIITSVADALSPVMKVGYKLTEGRKIKPIPKDAPVIMWKDFLAKGLTFTGEAEVVRHGRDAAVILYSGGTTGVSKGIMLSNLNFNALAMQTISMANCFKPGMSILSIMPMFHGFGLGIGIHTFLYVGGRCILVPRFTPASFAKLIKDKKPNFIAGVPSLYEALLRTDEIKNADLSCLKGVFSGGDSLSPELKKRFDKFLTEHNGKVVIREGYGTTESVTASCLTPYNTARENSIGIPFPDTYYCIVKPGTNDVVPYGEEGEICQAGPTIMMEYRNQPEETANTMRVHDDGLTWVHTGDLGIMDAEGFLYFKQRIKRMIVTNGYNVYPSILEGIIDKHEAVHMSCVIGVPDAIKIQKVKAFVMLKPGFEQSEEMKQSILEHCKKNIAKYAMPYDLEFRDELPKTLVGKVAYRVLEEAELKKIKESAAADQAAVAAAASAGAAK